VHGRCQLIAVRCPWRYQVSGVRYRFRTSELQCRYLRPETRYPRPGLKSPSPESRSRCPTRPARWQCR
jgi:hypothetical protein